MTTRVEGSIQIAAFAGVVGAALYFGGWLTAAWIGALLLAAYFRDDYVGAREVQEYDRRWLFLGLWRRRTPLPPRAGHEAEQAKWDAPFKSTLAC
jgi:hypothetical protein